jgi:hypothetical protein
VEVDNGTFLELTGPGYFTLAGYAVTNGMFSFIATDITGNAGATGTSSAGETFESLASTAAPEPSSLVLLGTGLLGAAFMLFRRNRARAGSAS